MFPLVAPDGWSPFERVESVEACPAQDSADGGGRDAHGPDNLDSHLALASQRRDAGDDVGRRGWGLVMRPRTTIGQALGAFGLVPGDPLAHGAGTDARGHGDEAYGQLVVEHASNQFGSTRGGGSGILMDSALRDETLALFAHQFRLWGSSGQPTERSQQLALDVESASTISASSWP